MPLYYIYMALTKHWKLFASLAVSLLFIFVLGFMCVQNKHVRAELKDIKAQQQLELVKIQAQNERIEKLSLSLKSDIQGAYLKNSEIHNEQLQNIQRSVDQSNANASRLYTTLNAKTEQLSNNTSPETLLRYVNVLSQSYRETNEAYGEAGESLERARVELEKCDSDMKGIYSAVNTYNENLRNVKGN